MVWRFKNAVRGRWVLENFDAEAVRRKYIDFFSSLFPFFSLFFDEISIFTFNLTFTNVILGGILWHFNAYLEFLRILEFFRTYSDELKKKLVWRSEPVFGGCWDLENSNAKAIRHQDFENSDAKQPDAEA